MKKILSVLLAIVMCASLVMTVSAANGSVAATNAEVTVGGATANVTVSLTSNPGIMAMTIVPSAPEGISLKMSGTGMGGGVWTIGKKAVWDNDSDSTFTGDVLNVEVTVDSSVAAGTYTVTFAVSGVNYNEEDVAFGTATATITVAPAAPVECDHVYGEPVVVAATCAEAGSKTYTCTKCGEVKVEEIPATGKHTYGEWTKVDDAEHEHVCSVCGKTEKEAHAWDEGVVTAEPTCVEAGEKTYTCAKCDATKTEEIAATGEHTLGDWVFVDVEYHEATCACGHTVKEAHTWDSGVVTVKPTETENGVRTYTCAVCKGTKTEVEEYIDDVPNTGDITPVITLGATLLVVMMGAVVLVSKRKFAK